ARIWKRPIPKMMTNCDSSWRAQDSMETSLPVPRPSGTDAAGGAYSPSPALPTVRVKSLFSSPSGRATIPVCAASSPQPWCFLWPEPGPDSWAGIALLRRLSAWQPLSTTPVVLPVNPDASVYAVALGLALASGILFGAVPVRQALRTDPY